MIIHVPDMRLGYITVCEQVMSIGHEVSPRGMRTKEILGAQIRIYHPADSLPVGINRKLNTSFAAVEALQLIAGRSYPGLTCDINPNMKQFLNGGKFHGAYGPRIRYPIRRAIRILKNSPDSRQALVHIWDSNTDLGVDTKDVPCTLTLQFLIRDDKLVMVTSMRSNDVWWGLAYDAFQFTQLQHVVAHVLGIDLGLYIHNAASLHAYERDWGSIESLDPSDTQVGAGKMQHTLGLPTASGILDAQLLASRILLEPENYVESPDQSIAWYARKIADGKK